MTYRVPVSVFDAPRCMADILVAYERGELTEANVLTADEYLPLTYQQRLRVREAIDQINQKKEAHK